jgi:hypothetical protein
LLPHLQVLPINQPYIVTTLEAQPNSPVNQSYVVTALEAKPSNQSINQSYVITILDQSYINTALEAKPTNQSVTYTVGAKTLCCAKTLCHDTFPINFEHLKLS